MSVRWTRTAKITNGKFLEAIGWAKETSSYVEKKWNTPPVSVWVDSFGEMGTIRWSIDYADLATVEKTQSQMLADAGYWQLVDKAAKAELFIDGSAIDTICRQV